MAPWTSDPLVRIREGKKNTKTYHMDEAMIRGSRRSVRYIQATGTEGSIGSDFNLSFEFMHFGGGGSISDPNQPHKRYSSTSERKPMEA